MTLTSLPVETGASRYTIELDSEAEQEYEVWLINTSDLAGARGNPFGPPRWLRHGVVGWDEVRWRLDADETDGSGLTLIEESLQWGTIDGPGVTQDVSCSYRFVSAMPVLASPYIWALIPSVAISVIYSARVISERKRPAMTAPPAAASVQPSPYGPAPLGPP